MRDRLRKIGKTMLISLTLMILFCIPTMAEESKNTVEPEIRILFVGNSSTYYNDMPQMVKGLATADERNVYVQAITASAYKLHQFANENDVYGAQVYSALTNYKWDYVILQDHREMIITDFAKSETAVSTLSKLVKNAGAQMFLYETQADYIGRNFTTNGYNFYLSHNEMQHYMLKGYYILGNKYGANVIASGINFERCLEQCPKIKLYNSDHIHPTQAGSYLAACTIYGTIFKTSPLGNKYGLDSTYTEENDTKQLLKKVSEEEAAQLQAIADPRLEMDTTYVEVKKGDSSKVSALFTANEENELLKDYKNEVRYSSTNDTAISVNSKTGVYNAVGIGDSMIMAATDSGLLTMCTISVKQEATSFGINEVGTAYLHLGETIQYTTKIAPDDTTDTITWKSNNPDIADVDEKGLVTAKKIGVAKITATTTSGIKDVRFVRVKLETPTNLKVKKLSTKAKGKKYANIRLTWTKSKGAMKYEIFRSNGSGYKKIATTTKARYTDKNRKKGKKFKYKIRAIHTVTRCNSKKTATVSITLKNK